MFAAAMNNFHLLAMSKHADVPGGVSSLLVLDFNGDTPLHHAARNGAVECGKLLLQFEKVKEISPEGSSSMKIRNKDGYTPLGLAAEYGRVRFINLLLAAGADPNEEAFPCVSGNRAVHFASVRGFHKALRALVNGGANATLKNSKGEDPSCLATGMTKEFLINPLISDLEALVRGQVDTEHVFKAIEEAFNADLRAFNSDIAEVVSVSCNPNQALGDLFVASARRLKSPHLRFLWHGCSARVLSTVLTEGFKTSFSSLDFNVYGAGIYFAVDAKLSVFFLTRNPATLEPIAPDEDGCYTLVLSAVLLGKTGVREPLMGGTEKQKKGMENALKHPANRNPPVGCHSATGKHLKEVVIYENTNAFPAFTVRFRINREAPPLPDPYSEDVRQEQRYLRSLNDAQHGIVMRREIDGTLTELDLPAPNAVQYDATLIMDWCNAESPILSRSNSNGNLKRQQDIESRLDMLESRLEAAERQNAILIAALESAQKSRMCVIQ
jgi:ankyrin repeat protein